MKKPRDLDTLAEALGGVAIRGVLPGSPAERAGVRYGDIVLSVNGMATPSLMQFLEARDVRHDRIDFEIFRDGATLELGFSLDADPERERARRLSS